MQLSDFFKTNKNCNHDKIRPDVDYAYCPDCGELIENQWYLVRCGCCGVKLRAVIKKNEIIPEYQFCHNCGTKDFIVERIEKINFIDINYAVLLKTTVPTDDRTFTQTWTDTSVNKRNTLKFISVNSSNF